MLAEELNFYQAQKDSMKECPEERIYIADTIY